tara:strand:- start:46 stop:381 length:336 start_codon:yes stop_codon:yes gene_type:complete
VLYFSAVNFEQMFNWKRKKKQNKDTDIEYSFIWYKRMETRKGKTFFTQPFRTKVKAKNYDEAKEKVTQFALNKMKLVIVSEDKFDKTDLSKLEKGFDDLYKQMNSLFDKFK